MAGEQRCGGDGGGKGLKGRGPAGKRGFSGLSFGQMVKEWRRWPAVSAASAGKECFSFLCSLSEPGDSDVGRKTVD